MPPGPPTLCTSSLCDALSTMRLPPSESPNSLQFMCCAPLGTVSARRCWSGARPGSPLSPAWPLPHTTCSPRCVARKGPCRLALRAWRMAAGPPAFSMLTRFVSTRVLRTIKQGDRCSAKRQGRQESSFEAAESLRQQQPRLSGLQ